MSHSPCARFDVIAHIEPGRPILTVGLTEAEPNLLSQPREMYQCPYIESR